MSSFSRTLNGINNQYLFYNVDYVVYVEGGSQSFSKDAVYNGSFNEDTEDIHFWTRIFESERSKYDYRLKSVGSKTTLIEIASDIKSGALDRIYLAMDCEFDDVLNKKIQHPNIFYTNGYSFENDIWSSSVIIALLRGLTAAKIDEDFIVSGLDKFFRNIKFAVVADGYFFSKGNSFFPRKRSHLFCIECNVDAFPEVKQNAISNLVLEKNVNVNTIRAFGYRKKIVVQKHCFGHLLADYCCQIIIHYLKKYHDKSGMKKDLLYRMAIEKFFDKFYRGSDAEVYYHKLLA